MKLTKEQTAAAFAEALSVPVPPEEDIPHAFSETFESEMDRLLAREAAHPFAVRHSSLKRILIAVVALSVLTVLCFSVAGSHNKHEGFRVEHFEGYDNVIFDETDRTVIEHEYVLTAVPEGFTLEKEFRNPGVVSLHYAGDENRWIVFHQDVPSWATGGTAIDNERAVIRTIKLDGRYVLYRDGGSDDMALFWAQDGYAFHLEAGGCGFDFDDMAALYRSVK